MRAAVAHITTFATMLHLAVGCCGHLSHFEGGSACCCGDLAPEAAVACCTDHDHDRESEPASHRLEAPGASGCHEMISVLASGHDCGGCHCVATIETVRFDPPALTVNCFLASIETKAIALLQAARGPCDAWKPPVPSELRPPLFERLVV